jgi:hypothetical protein
MRSDLPVTGAPGRAVLAVVRRAAEAQWDDALRAAEQAPGSRDDKVAALSGRYIRELTLLGAAAGGTAAVPGVGTVTAFGAIAAEVAAFAYRGTEMIIAIGAAHGHTGAGIEERMSWALAVLTHGPDAAAELGAIGAGIGAGLGAGMTAEAVNGASSSWFQTVNGYLGRKLVARLGARRGASVIGKALPFGIGAAFGAGTNYAVARRLARNTDRFFRQLSGQLVGPRLLPAPVS